MNILYDFFARFCGQARCFEIAGQTLPLCQRCLGLYLGAALTALYLLFNPAARRLPTRPLAFLHVTLLLTALLGGLHVLDPGPRFRLLCGLWTGHLASLWLIAAALNFFRLARHTPPLPRQPARQLAAAFFFPALLALLPLSFAFLGPLLGRTFWTLLASLGAATLALAQLAALAAFTAWLASRLRPRSPAAPS